MEMQKSIALKTLEGKEVTFTLKTILSQWDNEQIDSVYAEYLTVEQDGKTETPKISGNTIYKYRDKTLEVIVVGWSEGDKPTPKQIKQSLSPKEYKKLSTEVEGVVSASRPAPDKKKDSVKTSS